METDEITKLVDGIYKVRPNRSIVFLKRVSFFCEFPVDLVSFADHVV